MNVKPTGLVPVDSLYQISTGGRSLVCGLPTAGAVVAARHAATHGAADGGGGGGVDTLGAAADGAASGEAVERGTAVDGAAAAEGVGGARLERGRGDHQGRAAVAGGRGVAEDGGGTVDHAEGGAQ